MALNKIVGAAAGAVALAGYVDARLHIQNDLRLGSGKAASAKSVQLITAKALQDKLLVYNILEDRAGTAMGDNVFLIFEDRQWTYTQFFNALQPIGNWLLNDLGIRKGEIVALDGGNSPEYIMLWLALEGIGACTAFINCNLTAKPLLHCVKLCSARFILADTEVRHLVAPVEPELASSGTQALYYSPDSLQSLSDTAPLAKLHRTKIDPLAVSCLIYTSGTTGLPKGTSISRGREIVMAESGSRNKVDFKPGVRMYTCLPLYHGAAHGLCVLPSIGSGATVILSRKFSHKTFWPEVHKYQATHIQYVGELCRYLVNAAPTPLDKGHKVKVAWGNGMRPDVWDKFRERFSIEIIYELYAATDGMGWSTNANRGEFTRNAIGIRGKLWHLLNGDNEKRVLIDPDTQEILRGSNGFACEAGLDEAGEAIHRMDPQNPDAGTPTYFNNHGAAVERRIRDVFLKGDLWFRSGDLMRLDSHGRLFFVDRLGDTYRWKSENVSTNEVGDVVGAFPQVAEANIYGVVVPNSDGRAGCAAIVPVESVTVDKSGEKVGSRMDWHGLAKHLVSNLPRYAVPIFIRVAQELEYTGTMKMQKGRLRSEGIDLDLIEKAAKEKGEISDTLYWLSPGGTEYVPFRRKDFLALKQGIARL